MEQRKKSGLQWRAEIVVYLITAVLAIMSIVLTIIWCENHQNTQAMPFKKVSTSVSSSKSERPMSPMKGIRYEDTFMYQEEEFLALQKIIFAEAQGESIKGKVLVAASVVNRKKEGTVFPNSIQEVIKQPGQFASIEYLTDEYIANMNAWQIESWDECGDAAERALAGEDPAAQYLGGPTLFFYNPDKCSKENIEKREGILMYVEGNHHFHHEPPKG